ncbi:uncharacterized protein G2W53_033385 [Senna tora]|uniref:Uncharacterized protein n=1 Tax=Senna tora TaxID=362788 RepID=A0A834SYD4_9FABA|nr:uncharacterized protein G2W53_033385 [Senna tora]
MGLVLACEECKVMSKLILIQNLRLNLKRFQELQVKRVVAQVSQIDHFALHLGIPSGFNGRMGLMIAWKRGFNAQMGLVITWKEFEVTSKHILNQNSRLNLKIFQEEQVKCVVAEVSQTDRFALYLGIRVNLMLEWDS